MDRLRNFGFLMRDVSRLSAKNFERHALELNLTLGQCKVLGYVDRNQGTSQARLAELTDTDPMTLVRILDRMERDGLVERRADPADRRARQIFATEAAAPVLKAIWRVGDLARGEALTGLSVADREQLMSLLSRVHGNLSALLPGAAETERQMARKPGAALARKNAAPPRSARSKK